MALTDTRIRTLKPGIHPTDPRKNGKTYKLADSGGLHLQVTPKGGRRWRLKFRWEGKEQLLSFGTYPDVSLKDARDRRDEARKQLAKDINPSLHKKALKQATQEAQSNSFEVVAREWFEKEKPTWAESHYEKIIRRLEKDVFPWIGNTPIADLEPSKLLTVLRRVENRRAVDTAHRIHQNLGQIFRYAVATQRAERDQAADLKGALASTKEKHFGAITEPKQIGQLLRDIEGYQGQFVTRCALRLSAYVLLRPGELRHAEWSEFNLDKKEWRIPASKMKSKREHIVPLPLQVLEMFKELRLVTGPYRYVFPGAVSVTRPMSENTVNYAIRRLGYSSEEMTAHGFRTMASTRLNESGKFAPDVIEIQLAHQEKNEVRRAYNRAQHLDERRKMMQWWADYLDDRRAD